LDSSLQIFPYDSWQTLGDRRPLRKWYDAGTSLKVCWDILTSDLRFICEQRVFFFVLFCFLTSLYIKEGEMRLTDF
jgi:hypothetical protein